MPPAGGEVLLHTFFNVKEDAMQLFGFLSKDDMEIFKLLLGVNGVGPKAALGILSVMSADDIRLPYWQMTPKTISKAPGIGTKTARKLILELKDKLAKGQLGSGAGESYGGSGITLIPENKVSEASAALAVLGYSQSEIGMALKGIDMDGLPLEGIIKQALKKMVK